MDKYLVLNFFLCFLLLLLFPLGAVFVSMFLLFGKKGGKYIWLFSLMVASYLSFINCSKDIMSDPDLPWYTTQYLMAGDMKFIPYIFQFGMNGKGRELFFPTFNYLVYFIARDNVKLYIFIHSFICYFLSFLAIIRLFEYMRVDRKNIIYPIIWFACFPWVFTYTSTLLRQFLAGSILLCIIVDHCFYKKKMIIPYICMFLTHTSSLIFLPLLYLNFFKKKITIKTLVLYVCGLLVFVFIQSISSFLFKFVSGDNALSYVLSRASTNTTFELPPLGVSKILFLIMCIILCLYAFYSKKKKIMLSIEHLPVINCIVVFNLFILANLNQLELSNRFFFYSSILSTFPVIYYFGNKQFSSARALGFSLIMNLVLIFYITGSSYDYNIPFGLLLFPINNFL